MSTHTPQVMYAPPSRLSTFLVLTTSHFSTCSTCSKQFPPHRQAYHDRTCTQTEAVVSYPNTHSDQEASVVEVTVLRDSRDSRFHCAQLDCMFAHKDVEAIQVGTLFYLIRSAQGLTRCHQNHGLICKHAKVSDDNSPDPPSSRL
jgi:hypothetical protein